MWAQPEAVLWRKVDIPALSRLVWLQANPENWADSKLLSELRQLEDRFAMSIQSRHMMGLKITSPDAPAKPAATPATKDKITLRREAALRLVTGQEEAS